MFFGLYFYHYEELALLFLALQDIPSFHNLIP